MGHSRFVIYTSPKSRGFLGKRPAFGLLNPVVDIF
jgi:hypothetical protein